MSRRNRGRKSSRGSVGRIPRPPQAEGKGQSTVRNISGTIPLIPPIPPPPPPPPPPQNLVIGGSDGGARIEQSVMRNKPPQSKVGEKRPRDNSDKVRTVSGSEGTSENRVGDNSSDKVRTVSRRRGTRKKRKKRKKRMKKIIKQDKKDRPRLYNHFDVFMNLDGKLPWEEDTGNHIPFPILQDREQYEQLFQPPKPSSKVYFKFGYKRTLYKTANGKKATDPLYSLPQFPSLYTSVSVVPNKVEVLNCCHSTKSIIHRILTVPVSPKSNDNYVFVCSQPRHDRPQLYHPTTSAPSTKTNKSVNTPLQVYHLEQPEKNEEIKISLKFLLNHRNHGFVQDLCWYPFKCPSNIGILFIAYSDGQIGTYVVPASKPNHQLTLMDHPGSLFSFQFRNKYDSRILPCRIKVTPNFRYAIIGAFDGTLHLLKIRPFYNRKNSNVSDSNVNGFGRLQLVQTIQGHFPYYSTKNSCAVRGLDISYLNPSIVCSAGGDGIMRMWDIRSFGAPLSSFRIGRLWGTCCKWSFHTNKVYVAGHDGNIRVYGRSKCSLENCKNSTDTPIWEIDLCRDKTVLDREEVDVPIGMTREAGLRERMFCVGQDGSVMKVFQTGASGFHVFKILETEVVGKERDLCYRIGWINGDEVDRDFLNRNDDDDDTDSLEKKGEQEKKKEVIVVDKEEEEEEKKEKVIIDLEKNEHEEGREKPVSFLDEKPALYAIQFQKVLVRGMGNEQILILGGNYGLATLYKIKV